ncbi:FadR/GntR family transcriptional regulator [Pseudomonas batumici]|uniref:FadR/GntR family transcriptional regulator n=1 Tax=Pseudomonas batumici TaxID=226910 RepID=UPI000589CEED|nr:FadR/GntR family transcriptional regulator [Pseudomonas batumici]
MSSVPPSIPSPVRIKQPKRADLVTEDVKRLITARNLKPGDRLPNEKDLQELFGVSKSTTREALKSLEVQGLITISTGPSGGATIREVPLERTLQLMQNYLFFQDISMKDLYAARTILEPELAAGAVANLTDEQLARLEANIETCQPACGSNATLLDQRQSDLDFHDLLAEANGDPFLRFLCQLINELLRRLVVYSTDTPADEHVSFGCANVRCHTAILNAARNRDADEVRRLMKEHMEEAESFVARLNGCLDGRLILDSEMAPQLRGFEPR